MAFITRIQLTILTQILDIFSEVGTWFGTAIQSLQSIFWTAPTTAGGEGSLTLLGVLAVAGLAFSVVFLLVGIIQRFLKFQA